MSEGQVSIDVSQYVKGKEKGTTRIIKINGQPTYTQRKFDPDTGEAIPTNTAISRSGVVKAIESIREQLVQLETVLADMDAAKEVVD